MVLRFAFVFMAPGADPKKDRALIKIGNVENISVGINIGDFEEAARVCKNLVEKEGVQGIVLCPGFTNTGVAKVAETVGSRAAVGVARMDNEGMQIMGKILKEEGFI